MSANKKPAMICKYVSMQKYIWYIDKQTKMFTVWLEWHISAHYFVLTADEDIAFLSSNIYALRR